MLTVQSMHDDLDYWIHLGIGDDIIKLPEQRIEYQHLVKKFGTMRDNEICDAVLFSLRQELLRPNFLRPTYYRLLWLRLTRRIK